MNCYGIITIVINLLLAFFVYLQVKVATKSLRADHDRRKKQATLEYIECHHKSLRDDLHRIQSELEKQNKNLLELIKDKDLEIILKKILGTVAYLAVGSNMDIYDACVIYRSFHRTLFDIYNTTKPYIELKQKEDPYYYNEFVKLIKKLTEIKVKVTV